MSTKPADKQKNRQRRRETTTKLKEGTPLHAVRALSPLKTSPAVDLVTTHTDYVRCIMGVDSTTFITTSEDKTMKQFKYVSLI